MAIQLTTTQALSKFLKILVYGKSGIGKTRLTATLPKPIIISSENKLQSLSDENYPVIQVQTIEDFEESLNMLRSKKIRKKHDWAVIDSITDIAEVALYAEKKNHNDPRKAYGEIQDKMLHLLRQIRDSDFMNFYIIAKVEMVQNDDNVDQYRPRMPGRQMGPELPFLFDYVFPLRYHGDEDEDDSYVYLQTTIKDDIKWDAKAGTNKLNAKEKPDLGALAKKIQKKR